MKDSVVSTVVGGFFVGSDMSVSLLEMSRDPACRLAAHRAALVIRCLESELYAAIVALSIILVRFVRSTWFDTSCTATFPLVITLETGRRTAKAAQSRENMRTRMHYPLVGAAYQTSPISRFA